MAILKVLERQYKKQMKNKWYESYVIVDMHGVITRPNHKVRLPKLDFYPFALRTLSILSEREDIRLILYTSSYPDQRQNYIDQLKDIGIEFNYINENPEIRSVEDFGYYEEKPYFDVYLDDKAGFDPEIEWVGIYDFLRENKPPPVEWKNPMRRRLTKKELANLRRHFVIFKEVNVDNTAEQ